MTGTIYFKVDSLKVRVENMDGKTFRLNVACNGKMQTKAFKLQDHELFLDHIFRFQDVPIGADHGLTVQLVRDSIGFQGEDVGSMTFPICNLLPNTMISDWFMLSSPIVSVRVPIQISLHFCCNKGAKFEAPTVKYQYPLPQTRESYHRENDAKNQFHWVNHEINLVMLFHLERQI